MPSGLNISGGHISQNMADFGSSSGTRTAKDQGASKSMDTQFIDDMMVKYHGEANGRIVIEGQNDINGSVEGNEHERYNRHSPHQIQKLESFFNNCPNPDLHQRVEMSRHLGLTPAQIKYWFQNTRVKLKTQGGRTENSKLKVENERLLSENIQMEGTLNNAFCVSCAGQGNLCSNIYHLLMENLKLKDELNQMNRKMDISSCVPKPMPEQLVISQMDEPPLNVQRQLIIELADSAMQEFLKLALVVKPFWLPVEINGTNYILDEEKYFQSFLGEPAPRRTGFRWEATRDSATVMMNHANLVGLLMNVSQWSDFFCPIVANAIPLDMLSTRAAGSYDGVIQLMNVEFQMLTPFVPTRKTCMARFCKKYSEGIWAVVDVSLDWIRMDGNPLMKFLKRPSGCLIEQLQNESSKITWIEHVEVEDVELNMMYRWVIRSGVAFGAKHWLSIFHWRCRHIARSIASQFHLNDARSIGGPLKLAKNMVIAFCRKAGATSANSWETLSLSGGADEVKLMSYRCFNRLVISVATSIRLPASPKKVFNYFLNERNRAQWEILNEGTDIRKIEQITPEEETGNSIILLAVNPTENSKNIKYILQDAFASRTLCVIVYAPLDSNAVTNFLRGGAAYESPLFPSGLCIVPDYSSGGSLLMMTCQILVDSAPDVQLMPSHVDNANDLMSRTVERVRSAFGVNSVLYW